MRARIRMYSDMLTYPLKTSSARSSRLASSDLKGHDTFTSVTTYRGALTLSLYADKTLPHVHLLSDMAPGSIRRRLVCAGCPSLSISRGQEP